MYRFASGCAAFSLVVGATFGISGPVRADTCTAYPCVLSDDYQGGVVTYPSPTGDTIEDPGTHNFEITGATIVRPTASSLNIQIQTNFATITSANAMGTTYGSVFFGQPPITETYQPNQWTRAFVLDNAIAGTTTSGSGQLYNIGGGATPVPATGTPASYKTANGSIIMSNMNGNPVTYPHTGYAPFYFREGQAVQYAPDDPNANKEGTAGTWAASGDILTFVINDGGALTDQFVLAWTMTCGNDVFQGYVNIPDNAPPPGVPLPGAFALMGTVLFGAGGLAKWRKMRGRKAAA
jgi:hypothetical protein